MNSLGEDAFSEERRGWSRPLYREKREKGERAVYFFRRGHPTERGGKGQCRMSLKEEKPSEKVFPLIAFDKNWRKGVI